MAKRKRSKKRRSGLRGLGALGAVTTKDFVGVAGALCRTEATPRTVLAVSEYFKGQNPRFDRDRFEDAALNCTLRKSGRNVWEK